MIPDKYDDTSDGDGNKQLVESPNIEYVRHLVETHKPENRTEAMSLVMNDYKGHVNPGVIAMMLHEIYGTVK